MKYRIIECNGVFEVEQTNLHIWYRATDPLVRNSFSTLYEAIMKVNILEKKNIRKVVYPLK